MIEFGTFTKKMVVSRRQSISASSTPHGAYIKLLDADDWMNPEHIEAQVESIRDAKDVVSSCRWGYFVEDFTRPVVRDEHSNQDYDDPLEWLIDSLQQDEGMMGGWKWLIPRSVWDRAGGYDRRLGLNNDFHFSIQLLLASKGVRFAPARSTATGRALRGH